MQVSALRKPAAEEVYWWECGSKQSGQQELLLSWDPGSLQAVLDQ